MPEEGRNGYIDDMADDNKEEDDDDEEMCSHIEAAKKNGKTKSRVSMENHDQS